MGVRTCLKVWRISVPLCLCVKFNLFHHIQLSVFVSLHRNFANEMLLLRLVKAKRQYLELLRGRAPVGVDRRRDGGCAGERGLV